MKSSIFQNTTKKIWQISALEGFIDQVQVICFDYSQGDSTQVSA